MRRSLQYLLVLPALAITYLLLFPILAGSELVVRRSWAVPAASAAIVGAEGPTPSPDGLLPVRLQESFGYISPGGEMIYRGAVTYGVALAGHGFISFGRTPDQLVLQNPRGSYLATIPQSGYPQFTGNGLYVKSANDTAVTAYSPGGDLRWSVSLEGPLSSIRADAGITVLGLLSGGIVAIDDSGERIAIEGVENRYALAVYGSAVHGASGTVVAVYGPADPALVVYDLRNDRFIPSLRIDLQNNPGSLMAVEITLDGRHVIFEDHGIRIVHTASGVESGVYAHFPVQEIETGIGSGLIATLGLGEERDPQRGFRHPAELIVFDHDGVVPVRVTFPADRAFLTAVGGISYVGVDDRVLRFSVGIE